ncbi:RCC1/BLIP-II [Meredithblackwellia eburnea MCA 4105]
MDGQFISIGSNSDGQLGNGNTTDQHNWNTPLRLHLNKVTFGATFTLATTTTGQLLVTGNSTLTNTATFSQLQLEQFTQLLPPPHSQWHLDNIVAAWNTAFLLFKPATMNQQQLSDHIVTFGTNDWGERASPSATLTSANLVILPPSIPHPHSITSIQAGPRHVLISVTTQDNTQYIVTWGAGRHGQLGQQAVQRTNEPSVVQLPPHLSRATLLKAALGRDHTVLLFHKEVEGVQGKEIHFLGSNKQGQCQLPASFSEPARQNQLIDVFATWSTTFLISQHSSPTHTITSFGSNSHSQLLPNNPEYDEFPPKGNSIVRLATGSEHVLALLDNGQVWGWGWNEHGNLGLPLDSEDNEEASSVSGGKGRKGPRVIWSPTEGERVLNLWAGNATSFLLVSTSHPNPT